MSSCEMDWLWPNLRCHQGSVLERLRRTRKKFKAMYSLFLPRFEVTSAQNLSSNTRNWTATFGVSE